MEIFESTVTTNILLILYIVWFLFGKKALDAYSARKGSNQADKEDSEQLEAKKRAGQQPFDIELEKPKAQSSYVVEEFKESLRVRIKIKRNLYDQLALLKVYTRKFYLRSKSTLEAQDAFDNFSKCVDEISDFMSCNKHFIKEIDEDFLAGFEDKINNYMRIFKVANDSINSGEKKSEFITSRDQLAKELLDLIDGFLEKIFKINPAELPYSS